jgi:Ser/Thr protein kinase RdoA (MazF antagonist)
MKPYSNLSIRGKLRRLRDVAIEALAHYGLRSPEIAYHGFETNLLYQVTTATGERFMLRLAAPGWRTFEDLRSEALWLDALCRDTAVSAPRVMPTRSGEYVLPVSLPGIPDTWNATLMSWVPGRLLGCYLTERNLEKMGALFAELHYHGAAWVPPAGFTTRRFEHWLSRGEPNLIVDGGPAAVALPARARDLLERMHHHVESAYAAIDRSDLRVIHCDLWHDNIKLHQGALHPIDFEDTVWGFRAHDIAMAMLDLLEDTDEARYATLLAAFRRGYEAGMAWPDDGIEPFQIGRLLWKINWVAHRQPLRLVSAAERHVPVFEHYLRTGRVILG